MGAKMNGKKAKALRRIVYGKLNSKAYRSRHVVKLKSTGSFINIADIEEVDDGKGIIRKIPKRRIYRHLKRITVGVPRKQLERVLLAGKPKIDV